MTMKNSLEFKYDPNLSLNILNYNNHNSAWNQYNKLVRIIPYVLYSIQLT